MSILEAKKTILEAKMAILEAMRPILEAKMERPHFRCRLLSDRGGMRKAYSEANSASTLETRTV